MARSNLLQLARHSTRCIRTPLPARGSIRALPIIQTSKCNPVIASRAFHASKSAFKGLSPETDNPQPKKPEAHAASASQPTEISIEEYHQVSDAYMDTVVAKLEQLQEQREDVDVEFSVRNYTSLLCHSQQIHCQTSSTTVSSSRLIWCLNIGRRPYPQLSTRRNLRAQQAAAEQADLALVAIVWTEKIRLGCAWRGAAREGGRWRGGLDLFEGRDEFGRFVDEGATG